MTSGRLYAVLGAELLVVILTSAAASYRWRHAAQHPSLRLVATPAAKTRAWATQRAGAAYMLAFRVGCAALWVGVLLHSELGDHAGSHILLFFTTWNYLLQIVYWILAAVAGIRLLSKPHWALLETRAERALARTVWALFSVCLPSSVMVTVVLWGVLLPSTIRTGNRLEIANLLSITSFAQHLFNTLLLFADFSVNHMLVDSSTLVLVVSWNVCYVIFEWVAHFFSHHWTYFFLKLNSYTPFWYAALALVGVLSHMLACLLSRWKRKRLTAAAQPSSDETAVLEPPIAYQGDDADEEDSDADAYQRI